MCFLHRYFRNHCRNKHVHISTHRKCHYGFNIKHGCHSSQREHKVHKLHFKGLKITPKAMEFILNATTTDGHTTLTQHAQYKV